MSDNKNLNLDDPKKLESSEPMTKDSTLLPQSTGQILLNIGSVLGKIFFFIIGSFAAFYILEAQVHEPWKMSFDFQVSNALFFFLLLVFFVMITRRGLPAMIITGMIAFAIGYANRAVLVFRDNPIFPWDILSARTAFSVGDNYEWPLPENGWWILLFVSLAFVFALVARIKIPKGKSRHLMAIGSLTLLLLYGSLFQNYTFTNYFYFIEQLIELKYL